MNQLEEARQEINAVDEALAELFARRMEAAARIAAYKRANHLPVLDPAREQVVLERAAARVRTPALREPYLRLMRELMAISRDYQQQLLEEDASWS